MLLNTTTFALRRRESIRRPKRYEGELLDVDALSETESESSTNSSSSSNASNSSDADSTASSPFTTPSTSLPRIILSKPLTSTESGKHLTQTPLRQRIRPCCALRNRDYLNSSEGNPYQRKFSTTAVDRAATRPEDSATPVNVLPAYLPFGTRYLKAAFPSDLSMFTDDASHMGTRATPVKKKDLDRHDVPDTEEQSLFDLVQSRVLSKVLASVSPANDIMAIPNMDVKERAYRRFSDPTPDRATRSRHSDDDYSWSRPPSCPFQHYRATAMGRNEKVSGWDGAGSYQSDYDASLEGHHAKTDWSRYDIKTEIVNLAEGMEPNDGGNDDIKESDNPFLHLHPTIQVCILETVIDEAEVEEIPFYPQDLSKRWHPFNENVPQMYEHRRRLQMAHQAVSELDEDVIVAAATTRLPRLPMEVASQICKEHKRPRGRPPKSGYPPPVHTSTPDTIVVNAVPEYGLLSPPPCAHILPRDFVLSHAHNPKKPNQKYYPADRFFGITAEVIDVIFAKQKAEYWNESDKAPTAKDIHDAREYLRTHHWPERWLTSIWDGEPLEREVMEENEKAPERRVAEENERALGREKNDKEVDNESTRLGSSSPQKRGSDGSEEDVASVRSKKKVRFSDVMDLLSASDDKAPEKPKEDEQVDSGQVKYDLVLLGF